VRGDVGEGQTLLTGLFPAVGPHRLHGLHRTEGRKQTAKCSNAASLAVWLWSYCQSRKTLRAAIEAARLNSLIRHENPGRCPGLLMVRLQRNDLVSRSR
jgi:hypothetical protein